MHLITWKSEKVFDPQHKDYIKGPKPFTAQLFAFLRNTTNLNQSLSQSLTSKFATVRTGKLSNARQIAPLARMFEKTDYRNDFLSNPNYTKDAEPLFKSGEMKKKKKMSQMEELLSKEVCLKIFKSSHPPYSVIMN